MTKPESRTIQLWPGGESITYRGDIDGPAKQKRLKGRNEARWRQGTAADWRKVRIEVRAEMYGERDIHGCDSSLVGDLITAGYSGELPRELQEGFGCDEIRNTYADPSDWDAERCREYAEEHDLDLPEVPVVECPDCDEDSTERAAGTCQTCKAGQGEVPEPDYEEDDSAHGWLTEARDICREHAQDNPAEVYEWWRVSSWLCDQLHAIGEVTIDNGYGHWWGRQGTGQMWIMDGTLQKVAELFERPE